ERGLRGGPLPRRATRWWRGRRSPPPGPGAPRKARPSGGGARRHAVDEAAGTLLAGAVGAAVPVVARLHAVADDLGAAVLAQGRHLVDRALESRRCARRPGRAPRTPCRSRFRRSRRRP